MRVARCFSSGGFCRGLARRVLVLCVSDMTLRSSNCWSLLETFLLGSGAGELAILSVWHRRADLDAMLASGEEPLARRLIRDAGGTPEAMFYEILARSGNR